MKTIFTSLFIVFAMALTIQAQEEVLRAFPGAEGFGKDVTGGRGGKVYYVTSLEDNERTEGTLRYALSKSGARIIMFKVSGTIILKSDLKITRGNVTIAGQTAPGDGITLRDYTTFIDADNVIIRFLRFRMGDKAEQQNDALWGRRHKNIIIDHCSLSWSTDECGSFYDNEYFTLQWSILSESLRISVHDKGEHGYGGIWGGRGASFHHNLLADHDSRNPRFCGSRYSNRPDDELIDHRNNVIFNWGGNSAYAAEGGSYNMINNYYKAGPASSNKDRIIQPYADNGGNSQPAGTYGIFYVNGNYMTASSSTTANNKNGIDVHSTITNQGLNVDDITVDKQFTFQTTTTHTAEKAYEKVLSYVGASLKRDAVDIRIIDDVTTGTPTYMTGGNGSKNGLIDTQDHVGGWPTLNSTAAPADTDEDGMPDEWETANSLNPNDPTDAQLKTVDGLYPNLEVYLNSLVADIISNQNSDGVITNVDDAVLNSPEIDMYYVSSSNQLVIHHTNNVKQVMLYSINGGMIMNKSFNTQIITTGIPNVKNGNYIVKVIDDKQQQFAEIITIR